MEVIDKREFDPNIWKLNTFQTKDSLICTMLHSENLQLQIRNILDRLKHNLYEGKVLVLDLHSSGPNHDHYAITYNIKGYVETLPYNSFKINRRKDSKTMYTIDALNRMDKIDGYDVDWEKYTNSLCVEKGGKLQVYSTTPIKFFYV